MHWGKPKPSKVWLLPSVDSALYTWIAVSWTLVFGLACFSVAGAEGSVGGLLVAVSAVVWVVYAASGVCGVLVARRLARAGVGVEMHQVKDPMAISGV